MAMGDTGGTEYMMDLTYPTYDKVEQLIESNFCLSSENSEMNYECMKNIFNNYNNKETVKRMGEQINERGGFQALQANFYILWQVLQHLLHDNPEREPELRPFFITIRNNVKLYWDGVGDWKY